MTSTLDRCQYMTYGIITPIYKDDHIKNPDLFISKLKLTTICDKHIDGLNSLRTEFLKNVEGQNDGEKVYQLISFYDNNTSHLFNKLNYRRKIDHINDLGYKNPHLVPVVTSIITSIITSLFTLSMLGVAKMLKNKIKK